MLIDKPILKTPILFFAIPKNASDSIKRTFKLPLIRVNTVTYFEVKKHNYKKFTIVRNPLYRVISMFFHLSRLLVRTKYMKTQNSIWYKVFLQGDIENSFDLFLDFIEFDFYDHHVIPQYLFL